MKFLRRSPSRTTLATPVLREIAARPAELAAKAGEATGPAAHKAAVLTEEVGGRLAVKGHEIAPGPVVSESRSLRVRGSPLTSHPPPRMGPHRPSWNPPLSTSPWLGTPTHPRMIVIRIDDHLEFVPTEVSVTPGETILFVLANVGSALTHEFQVGPADRVSLDQVDGQIVIEADKIEPLHVDYLTYTFGGVGPDAFACHEPGHYEAGMKGIIDLTP